MIEYMLVCGKDVCSRAKRKREWRPQASRCSEKRLKENLYRTVFPNARQNPGFTHEIDSARRLTCSRIDYIWTRGFALASVLQCSINRTMMRNLSHHHILFVTLRLPHAAPSHSVLHAINAPPRLPNLRATTQEQAHLFTQHLEPRVRPLLHDLQQHLAHGDHGAVDAPTLSSFASHLSCLVRTSAFCKLPLSRAPAYTNKDCLQLQRLRRDLTRLVRIACMLVSENQLPLTRSPEWLHLQRKCVRCYDVVWLTPPSSEHAWIAESKQLIRNTRSALHKETQCMKKLRADRFDATSTAMVQQMLQGLEDRQLFSVLDQHDHLITDPDAVKQVMVDHFRQVFALPPSDPTPLPHPPPSMLFDKPNIDPAWFADLMRDVTAAELLPACKDVLPTSAPGEDLVSTGVWKLALQSASVTASVCTLFTACLRSSTFPACWKGSVIVPLVKDTSKERSMSNVRPISLQNCLGKLFSKVLAMRLGNILVRHPILNPSQRGFIPGGNTKKCIDELLDAWSWSRKKKQELHCLFYDIKQAYDSVQTDVLVRALQRLRLPPSFVSLIKNSLTDLTSCVRTQYGLSRSFSLQRSVRQGDPLAPILFIILMDALHDGLQENPFTGSKHGCSLTWHGKEVYLPSLGYADDSTMLTRITSRICASSSRSKSPAVTKTGSTRVSVLICPPSLEGCSHQQLESLIMMQTQSDKVSLAACSVPSPTPRPMQQLKFSVFHFLRIVLQPWSSSAAAASISFHFSTPPPRPETL